MEDGKSLPPGIYCGQCKRQLEEPVELPREQRTPCSACGSLGRLRSIHVCEEIKVRSMLDGKARRGQPGKAAPFLSFKIGSCFDRDTGRWLDLEQIVDRENKRYRKRLLDPATGEVIRDTDEPLTEHEGNTWRKPS